MFRIADAGQGLGEGLRIPLQIGVHPVLAQQTRLADLVQKFVDLLFDPDFLLEYALCHFPFSPKSDPGGCAIAIRIRPPVFVSRLQLRGIPFFIYVNGQLSRPMPVNTSLTNV